MRTILLVSALAGCGDKLDDCQRAHDRLVRIGDASVAELALQACRQGGTASYNPVLRCAMDSRTDDDARSCIVEFVTRAVSSPDGAHGSGFNPLLK